MPSELLVWLFRCGAFLFAAIYLIKTGYWPRRTGTEPHCRRCEYNLAQAVSDRCPECGAVIRPDNTRVGRRIPVRWRIVTGLVCALIALVSLGGGAWAIYDREKLQSYLPASTLLSNLSNPDEAVVKLALRELTSRWKSNRLDRQSLDALIEYCIRDLDNCRSDYSPYSVHVLEELVRKNAVSVEQWRRIAPAGMTARIAMPEFVELGVSYPARLELANRLQSVCLFLNAVQVDDLTPQKFTNLRLIEGRRMFPSVKFESAGRHVVRFDLQRDFMVWNAESSRLEFPLPSERAIDSVWVDALEPDAFEARLASALADAVELVEARAYEPRHLLVDIRFKHQLPVPIELELCAERGNPFVVLGKKHIEPGSAGVINLDASFPGIHSDTLNFLVRLTRSDRINNADTPGPILPDREIRFPSSKVNWPVRQAAQK